MTYWPPLPPDGSLGGDGGGGGGSDAPSGIGISRPEGGNMLLPKSPISNFSSDMISPYVHIVSGPKVGLRLVLCEGQELPSRIVPRRKAPMFGI
jgi:hypothetical protein